MNRQPNRVYKIKHINIQSLKPKIHLVKKEPLHSLSYKAILDFALSSNKLRELVNQFSVTNELRSDHLTIQLSLDTKIHNLARPDVESKVVTKINWHRPAHQTANSGQHELQYNRMHRPSSPRPHLQNPVSYRGIDRDQNYPIQSRSTSSTTTFYSRQNQGETQA